MKKKFSKMNAKNMLIISLLTDSIALLLAVLLINPELIPISVAFCKIYQSLTFIIPAYSSWILVYISLEHGTKQIAELFGNKWFQLIS
jgi:CBS domain containing-hemolysin-like protein